MLLLHQIQFALCAFNLGAISFVQWVHYPLFAEVGRESFVSYHHSHVSKTTLLLGTTLFVEMVLNLFLFYLNPLPLNFLPLFFLSIGWITTFVVSVPQHRKLERGFEPRSHRTLLFSNLIRVISWGGTLIFLFFNGSQIGG